MHIIKVILFEKFLTVDVACCLMLIRSQVPCLILNCVFFVFCLFVFAFIFIFIFAFLPLLLTDN